MKSGSRSRLPPNPVLQRPGVHASTLAHPSAADPQRRWIMHDAWHFPYAFISISCPSHSYWR